MSMNLLGAKAIHIYRLAVNIMELPTGLGGGRPLAMGVGSGANLSRSVLEGYRKII